MASTQPFSQDPLHITLSNRGVLNWVFNLLLHYDVEWSRIESDRADPFFG